MNGITTHVLDTSRGRPAADLRIELHKKSGEEWQLISEGSTDPNGRCNTLLGDAPVETGTYRLLFHAGTYFQGLRAASFYSEIPVVFEVREPGAHYHVPLLLSPFGYSTYRGS